MRIESSVNLFTVTQKKKSMGSVFVTTRLKFTLQLLLCRASQKKLLDFKNDNISTDLYVIKNEDDFESSTVRTHFKNLNLLNNRYLIMRISVFHFSFSGSGEENFRSEKKIKIKWKIMTEVANLINNSGDKVASLMKEAENLKQKLEEERQKLNDVTCKKKVKNNEKQKQSLKFSCFQCQASRIGWKS